MRINGKDGVAVSYDSSRVIITFSDEIEHTFNATQVAMVRQGYHRRMEENSPYEFTVKVYGTRGLLEVYKFQTAKEAGALAFAFQIAIRI